MKGKFGRILGDFDVYDGKRCMTVTKVLIEEGHAVDYYGGSKEEIQEQHIKQTKINWSRYSNSIMAVLFDEILNKGIRQGKICTNCKARDWYRDDKDYKNVKENDFFGKKGDKDRMTARLLLDRCIWVLAKHKDTCTMIDLH